MKKNLLFIGLTGLLILSCKKKEDPAPTPTPVVNANAPKTYEGLTFNTTTAYFSTDGTMTAPVDSTQAKTMIAKLDLTFIFNFDYTEPGFMDPRARSQQWYWNDYKQNWLSTAVETRFYVTKLTKAKFDEAKADQSKIGVFFADTTFKLAPHSIFTTGSCIGGRESDNPTSATLAKGQVYGFKNTASGKRGLLYIRTDQYNAWPVPISNTNTKVDLIREQ